MNETFIKEFTIDDTSVCDNLIHYFQENKEYKSTGVTGNGFHEYKKSTDLSVFNHSNDIRIKNYFFILSQFVKEYIVFYNLKVNIRTQEGLVIQHYKPNEGFLQWHFERMNNQPLYGHRALVFMTYLNNLKDGGGTEFMYQKKKFKAKKGLTLIWPTDFTHTHRGIVSKTEEKYIATGWFHFI